MGVLTHKQLISLLESDPFDLKQITTPDNIRNLLLEKDNNSAFIGHTIAYKNEHQTLLNFFDLVESTAKDLVPEVSTQLDKNNQTIGHYLAANQKPEALDKFLKWVATHAPESLTKVLTQANLCGWTMGHIIANQRPEALDRFFQLVDRHTPGSLAMVLTQADKHRRTMGHFIAHHQKPGALDTFLQLLAKHAPKTLDKVLTETTGPTNDIIIFSMSGSAIYKLLMQEINLSTTTFRQLAPMKEEVLEHMKTLPLEEQISSFEKALDKTHPLGILFHVQRGFFSTRADKGTLLKIAQLSTPSNHVQMSIFNTTSPETPAAESHNARPS